jgi:hypothetical protein
MSILFTPEEVLFEMSLLKEFARQDPWFTQEYKQEFSRLAEENQSSIIVDIERAFDKNVNAFNVMSPAAGPWFIDPGTSVHVKEWLPSVYEVIFDCYVGHLHLFENKCGMDNLKKLMEWGA